MKNPESKHLLYSGCHFYINFKKYYVVGFGVVRNSKNEYWIIQTPNMELDKRDKDEMDEIVKQYLNENSHLTNPNIFLGR